EIRGLADRMRAALREGDLESFGHLLHEGWEAKKRVSSRISNTHIDEMGALGGKITGAGGGGFLLLFCAPDRQSSVRDALTAMGAREMGFEFDFQGAHVVVNDPFIDADESGGIRWTFTRVASRS